MRLLPILLLAGCVTETVSLDVHLDTTACTARQEIASVEAYVLRVGADSLCTLSRGSAVGNTGTVVLKPGTIDDGEVVVLALAYGKVQGGCDGSSCGDVQATCGDNACTAGESCKSCPVDCGTCPPGCGDGQCDPSTEDCQSCPKDCGTCNTGPNSGQLCSQSQPCPLGDSCIMFSSANTYGMCVIACQTASAQCPSSTPGTFAACVLSDSSGGLYCAYICEAQGQTYSCPQGLTCVAQPNQNVKVCFPPGGCGDGKCDPNGTEDCQSCPQDCGQCPKPDAGQAGYGLAPCVRCHGLARVKLGERGGSQTVELVPTAGCAVPVKALEDLQLPAVSLPPGDC